MLARGRARHAQCRTAQRAQCAQWRVMPVLLNDACEQTRNRLKNRREWRESVSYRAFDTPAFLECNPQSKSTIVFGVQYTCQSNPFFGLWMVAIQIALHSNCWIGVQSGVKHYIFYVQSRFHSILTGHVDEMTKTKFCLGNKQFPKSGMKLPHSS